MFCLNTELRSFYSVFIVVYVIFCTVCVYYVSVCNGSSQNLCPRCFETLQKTVVSQDINLPYIFVGSPQQKNVLTFDLSTNQTMNKQRRPCTDPPPGLLGKLKVSGQTTVEDVYDQSVIRSLKPGGLFVPNCIERDSIAIIIPYRDRADHLRVQLHHLHTVLQRQQLKYAIFVVELAYPTQFNRGILANVGFLTASKILDFSCYIIHDVDLLLADDRNLYRCSNNPVHLSVSSSKYGYKLPYGHYNGGVVALTKKQYLKINGFSNAYFGWGKEDDDLHKRMVHVKYKIERPNADIGRYVELDKLAQNGDYTNPDNPMKDLLLMRAEQRYSKDGVNKVLYTQLAVEFRPLYTWVFVNTSELSVMRMVHSIDPSLKSSFAKINLS